MNYDLIPTMFRIIIDDAFGVGQLAGGAIGITMREGVKRGLFSNEAGEGSAPNAAATATVSHPVKQGLIQSLGVFTDTLVVCSCTAFIILLSGLYSSGDYNGIILTQYSLESQIGPSGKYFVAMAILLVNGNLGAGVATVGVFSLVRFRSIPGNSRSLLAVFFAMAIGLAVGTGYVVFAALFTAIIGLIIFVLSLLNFGASNVTEKKLVIVVPEDLDYTDIFDDVFEKYTNSHYLQKTKTTNMGSLFQLTYRVVLKADINEKRFIDKIRSKNGNLKVVLSQPMEEEEL